MWDDEIPQLGSGTVHAWRLLCELSLLLLSRRRATPSGAQPSAQQSTQPGSLAAGVTSTAPPMTSCLANQALDALSFTSAHPAAYWEHCGLAVWLHKHRPIVFTGVP
jgi:hypothetical protein